MASLLEMARQIWPPKPRFTEKELQPLDGKVYIVTGANTGVGKELAQILYSKNATVYVAARSKDKALAAIESIKAAVPQSCGQLVFLHLDLADLSSIKASADDFLSKETKLHVLFNNAGLMRPIVDKTAQGYEAHLGVNNIGTFMFTKLLTPILVATAKVEEAPGIVRVVWVSSSAAEGFSPKGGVDMTNLDYHRKVPGIIRYGISKAGNYLHATEFAHLHKADGIISIACNPGNLTSDLWRTVPAPLYWLIKALILYPCIYGAYTELFCGLSPEVTLETTGGWVVPWGRFQHPRRTDLLEASKGREEGGTGTARAFWEWSEDQVRSFL